ncbi:MAG: PAS domain-containing protein [Verrucomicrobia bacterium]|nr:PAS domain-containing protein [Verrucomicrobiota bacterium]
MFPCGLSNASLRKKITSLRIVKLTPESGAWRGFPEPADFGGRGSRLFGHTAEPNCNEVTSCHRQALFPRTPLLIAGTDERHVQQATLTPNDAVVAARIEPTRVMRTILELLPQTTNVVVVIGASPLEQFWLQELRKEYQQFTNRVSFEWFNELSFGEMLERCAALPPQSAVFFAIVAVDAKGVPQWEQAALTRLHEVANAPIFGVFETQLGRGIVGGPLVDMVEMGQTTAKVARRILDGEAPAEFRLPPLDMGVPKFDWRELRRWRISKARLPAGSTILFRPPRIWERYWWLICGGIAFAAMQAALIVGLLVHRVKRREGEEAATLIADLSSRFINLPSDQVDAAIEAAQRRVCESLGFDLSALWQWSIDQTDDLVLTHVCRLVDGPPIPARMRAQERFPWCLQEVKAKRCVAFASVEETPPEAARDVEAFRHFGIKSNLTIPLVAGEGPALGTVSFNTIRRERIWSDEIVQRLQLVAQIFANALARKRADQELRESEARLSLAAEAAGAGLWRLDLATRRYWVTHKTRELFGFGADEIVTFDRFLDTVHPEDRELVRQKVREAAESTGQAQAEYRILVPDRGLRWIFSRGRVQTGQSGQPDSLMGVSMDITDRKLREEALRSSEERLATGAELAGLGFYEVTDGERVTYMDQSMRAIMGVPPEVTDERATLVFWLEHVHPEDRHRIQDAHNQLNDGKAEKMSAEYRYVHPQRGLIWIDHLARVLERNAAGRATYTVGVIRDITERKHVELERLRLRDNLAHLTRVNTLGALSGSLAHELNQPLGIILTNAEAAQDYLSKQPPDIAEVQDILADIVKADRRAGEVIERLRALFKGGQVSMQKLSLNAVIEEVLNLTHAELLARGISVIRELASDLPLVKGDRVQLQQLVLNLILNAVEAMAGNPPGRRRIHLTTKPYWERVRASVRDEGAGLPVDVEKLFQPLYTTKSQGMGMGLAICRSIIEAHDGRLWAETHHEGGAIFHFELPVAEEASKNKSTDC